VRPVKNHFERKNDSACHLPSGFDHQHHKINNNQAVIKFHLLNMVAILLFSNPIICPLLA
jgi:hypothetical protein